jgi:hypothetical protein
MGVIVIHNFGFVIVFIFDFFHHTYAKLWCVLLLVKFVWLCLLFVALINKNRFHKQSCSNEQKDWYSWQLVIEVYHKVDDNEVNFENMLCIVEWFQSFIMCASWRSRCNSNLKHAMYCRVISRFHRMCFPKK